MRRFLPRSLIGQIALAMAAALLVAQAINFGLVYNERQRASRVQAEGPAVGRFVSLVQRVAPLPAARRPESLPQRGRRGRYTFGPESSIPAAENDSALAERLLALAEDSGVQLRDARGAVGGEVALPEGLPPPARARAERRLDRVQALRLSAQLPDGVWLNGQLAIPRPDPWVPVRLAASTLLIYLILLAAMIWIAMRLGRPLRALTAAAESFEGRGESPRVEPQGPGDVRRAILAFNAMSARVSTMLDEKDRMLGAIGHDLRTPLASLRIRAESVEPAEERARMIATIAEMTAMLDDTLALARSGRALETVRKVDLNALADTVVEEFLALGHDVALEETERRTATVQPNLLRRAVRNLVENAVKYGNVARVAVRDAGESIAIEVADEGPGIPEAEFENVQEAFVRLESSRSRETGGSGLGLALARGAAQAHGGTLELANRPQGGLVARILLPKDA